MSFPIRCARCLIYFTPLLFRRCPAVFLLQSLSEFSTGWPKSKFSILLHQKYIHRPTTAAHEEASLRRHSDGLATPVLGSLDAEHVQRL